uniref:E3 ubiquitin-protein ligase RNF14-like n=1 Tax=Kryptolebias marmoratus TaxID=37003 RepID=A0A3Q3A6Q7_KRYMA
MNADQDEQEDELLALQSIFGSEEFVRYESEFAGEIQVLIDLPVDFNVLLKHGKTRRQDAISFLPPLLLTFELPADYPSSSPPSFTLTCSWLTHTQLGSLSAQLIDLYQATEGSVVLFSWIQFLREDALKLLNIHSLLELPSDQPSTMSEKQDKQDNSNTPKSEPTDVPGLCGPDKSASSEDVLLNSSSATKKPDFHGASSLDSHKANKDDFNQSSLNSEFKTDYPNALSSETKTQNAHGSEATAFQTSEFKADNQNDLSSAADKSELLPFSEFVQINREDVLSKSDVSASVMPPSSSSNLQYPSEKEPASLPVQATKMSLNNGQTFSGFSITPSQKLLSQILIYNAEQKQRVFATTVFNCSVCYMDWLGSECVQLYECGHIFCRVCLRDFCKVQITEGNVQGVICPQEGCTVTPTPAQVQSGIE